MYEDKTHAVIPPSPPPRVTMILPETETYSSILDLRQGTPYQSADCELANFRHLEKILLVWCWTEDLKSVY